METSDLQQNFRCHNFSEQDTLDVTEFKVNQSFCGVKCFTRKAKRKGWRGMHSTSCKSSAWWAMAQGWALWLPLVRALHSPRHCLSHISVWSEDRPDVIGNAGRGWSFIHLSCTFNCSTSELLAVEWGRKKLTWKSVVSRMVGPWVPWSSLEEVSGEAHGKTHFQGPSGSEMLFAGIAFVSVCENGAWVET